MGKIKGVGKIYQQTVIDTYSRVTEAKLYTDKTPITSADILSIITDRGTEYCGSLENHAYQLYLSVEGIEHTKTKANSPQICTMFHKTEKCEFYDAAFRKKIYSSLQDWQQDVDL